MPAKRNLLLLYDRMLANKPSVDSPHPLMHRTETVDYGIVIEGEITLVLDDFEVLLRAGSVVSAARHKPCLGEPLRAAMQDAFRAGGRNLRSNHRHHAGWALNGTFLPVV
jgi:hypothetical protein